MSPKSGTRTYVWKNIVLLLIGGCEASSTELTGEILPDAAESPTVAAPLTRGASDTSTWGVSDTSEEHPASDLVASADIDGNGSDEIFLFRGDSVSVNGRTWVLGGRPQAWAPADLDSDGRQELIVATGMGRGSSDAPIRIWNIGAEEAELLLEFRTRRSQVSDLQVADGRILISYFEDTHTVQSSWLVEGELEPLHSAHMAMSQYFDDDRLVVGRLYGDAPRSHGSLSLVNSDGTETALPSLRGVQTIAAVDMDGDEHSDLLVSDGWHFAYGENATARVVMYAGPDWLAPTPLAWLPEDYTVREIDIHPEPGGPLLLLTGSHGVHLAQPGSIGWTTTRVAPVSETGNGVFRRTAEGLSIVVAGDPTTEMELSTQ